MSPPRTPSSSSAEGRGSRRLPPGAARGCEGGSLQQPLPAQPAGIECLLYVRPGAGAGGGVKTTRCCSWGSRWGREARLSPGLEPAHPLRDEHLCSVCLATPYPHPHLGAQPEAAEQTFLRLKARGPGRQETRDTRASNVRVGKTSLRAALPAVHSWFRTDEACDHSGGPGSTPTSEGP